MKKPGTDSQKNGGNVQREVLSFTSIGRCIEKLGQLHVSPPVNIERKLFERIERRGIIIDFCQGIEAIK